MRRRRLPVFPLGGAVLFPGMHLPLHIFEPRYRSMILQVMSTDRLIGMIQPRGPGDPPPLYETGCVGRMVEVEAMEDGRYNILLEGICRFRIIEELTLGTAFRQVDAAEWDESLEDDSLASIERASIEVAARRFADAQGYAVDWDAVQRLDDRSLVNGIAQIAPFDIASKQALLEVRGLSERAETIVQLMQFFSARGEGGGRATLQ